MNAIDKLHAKRRALVESILWGFSWNQKKVKQIDESIETINRFMITMCRLGFHDIGVKCTIKRGEPLAYLMFEHPNPDAKFTVFECQKTPEVQAVMNTVGSGARHMAPSGWLRGTIDYVKNYGKRRPKELVIPRRRD